VSEKKEVRKADRILEIAQLAISLTLLARNTGMARKDGLIAFKTAAMGTELVSQGIDTPEYEVRIMAFIVKEVEEAGPVYEEES
jgi:hypothetical protein